LPGSAANGAPNEAAVASRRAIEQVAETPESPVVDTPDIGDNLDRAVSPPPSKVKLLLDDPAIIEPWPAVAPWAGCRLGNSY
jgi:hypothetical protein